MRSALEHSLEFDDNNILNTDASRMLVSNKVILYFATSLLHNNCLQNVSQFTKDLQDKSVDSGNPNLFISSTVGYIYDAVWTIALALNSSISILEDKGLGRLEDFTYDSVEMANVFTEAVANVSFEGISVSYNNIYFLHVQCC